jgi:hypothetical protein
MRQAVLLLFAVVLSSSRLPAQRPAWEPGPGHPTLLLWPQEAPGARPHPGPEVDTTTAKDHLVAGRSVVRVGNVSVPTLTVYAPAAKNTGAAIIVFPGGSYRILAIDLEGTEVCDWLSAKCINLRAAQVPRPRHRSLPQVFSRPSRRPASRRPLPLPRCRMVVRRCRRC